MNKGAFILYYILVKKPVEFMKDVLSFFNKPKNLQKIVALSTIIVMVSGAVSSFLNKPFPVLFYYVYAALFFLISLYKMTVGGEIDFAFRKYLNEKVSKIDEQKKKPE